MHFCLESASANPAQFPVKRCAQFNPEGSKVPNYRVCRVFLLGIVTMVLGRYLVVGYLDSLETAGDVIGDHDHALCYILDSLRRFCSS